MVKKINKAAEEGKASKANGTTITRKGATKGAEKSAAKGKTKNKVKQKKVEPVIEGPHFVDLTTITKKPLRPMDIVRGAYYVSGEMSGTFTENGCGPQNSKPWEVRVKLAEEKPYSRISANCNGGFLVVYVPKENFKTNREFREILLDRTELLVEKMDGIDTVGVIEKLYALKQELLKAA